MINICYEFNPPKDFRKYIFEELPKDTIFSLEELKSIVENITSLIPYQIWKSLYDNGWKVIITNQRNLEKEYGFDIKVHGLTDFQKKEIITYANPTAIKYSIPHEVGHYVDSLFGYISQSEEWESIFNMEENDVNYSGRRAPRIKDYFVLYDTPEEFFAECFGMYILMPEKEKQQLKKEELLIHALECIERMIKVVPYVEKKEESSLENHRDEVLSCETRFWE